MCFSGKPPAQQQKRSEPVVKPIVRQAAQAPGGRASATGSGITSLKKKPGGSSGSPTLFSGTQGILDSTLNLSGNRLV